MNFIKKIKQLSYKSDIESIKSSLSKSSFSDFVNGKKEISALAALHIAWSKGIYIKEESAEFFPYNLIYDPPVMNYFWDNIDAIFGKNLNDLRIFLEELNFDSKKILIKRGRNISPGFSDAIKISKKLNTSIFLLFSNDIDLEPIRKSRDSEFKENSFIPFKYTEDEGSKMRTFEHIVSSSKDEINPLIIDEILMRMQISQEALGFLSKDINIYTFHHFYTFLKLLDCTDMFFLNIGARSIEHKVNRIHFKQLLNPKSIREVYERCNKLIWQVDKNFKYQITKITNSSCTIETSPIKLTPHQKINEGLLSREVMLFRLGHLIIIPKYFRFKTRKLSDSTYTFNIETGEAILHIVY